MVTDLTRLLPLRQPHPVDFIGYLILNARVHPIPVVPVQVLCNLAARYTDTGVGELVEMLVFHRTPQSLDKHTVTPCATSIHGKLNPRVEHCAGEVNGCELTALIGINNLRHTVAGQGLAQDLHRMARLQCGGHFMCHDTARGYIDDSRQVDISMARGEVGRIECPHLMGSIHHEFTQQVGVDLVTRRRLGTAGLRCLGLHVHGKYEGAYVKSADLKSHTT
jgi:hypothetical protein